MEIYKTCLIVAFLLLAVVAIYVFFIQYELSKPIYEIREIENSVGVKKYGVFSVKYDQIVSSFDTLEEAQEYFNENCL
jgi:capsular polysaccharide biosynthesis protein